MRSFLIPADSDPGFAVRLETSLALARAHRGHLSIQIDSPIEDFIVFDALGGMFVASDALADAGLADTALGERLDHALARQDVPFDIEVTTANRLDALCAAAALADLTVLDLAAPWCEDALVRLAAPVLALPQRTEPVRLDGIACIGWDSSPTAARAVRAAAPLLRACAHVVVVTVGGDPSGKIPSDTVLRYLSRHDVHAELRTTIRGDSVEQSLAAEAARTDADFVVMGAYGHSRWREAITGGVTRYFLREQAWPLLLVH